MSLKKNCKIPIAIIKPHYIKFRERTQNTDIWSIFVQLDTVLTDGRNVVFNAIMNQTFVRGPIFL